MRYEELEHTADVRLKVYGADREELFANAAFALFDTVVELGEVKAVFCDEIEVEGGDLEETLVNFLGELLYRFEVEGRLYGEFDILELSDERVRVASSGELRDVRRHGARRAVKAVTFHDVEIVRGAEGLSVVLTLDV